MDANTFKRRIMEQIEYHTMLLENPFDILDELDDISENIVNYCWETQKCGGASFVLSKVISIIKEEAEENLQRSIEARNKKIIFFRRKK